MKIHVISSVKQKDCETTTAACDFINQGHTPTDCDCVMSIPSLTLWYYGCFELVLFAVGVHRAVVVKMRLITPIQTGESNRKRKKKAFSVKYKNIKESVITTADKMLLPPSSTTVVALQVTIICASGYMLQHLEALQDWRCALGEADHWGRRYGNNTLDCLKVSPGQEK